MAEAPRILVVEDNPLIALDIVSELTDRGFEVVGPVGRVEKGLDLIAREQLSIAVLDVSLGADNSFEIARALRNNKVPFIFVSGNAGALPDEFCDQTVLVKPIDYELLDRTLKAELR